ncbi:hypothetical protein [Enterobacter mori]|uniref:hypothetical protein n=1 Tax=Enterobacter mori TaxID=539813 RepID=UPI001FD4C1AD|nr:hypothetical protein [Enterobacter mori]
MPFIIGFSSFSMASVLAADAGFIPVTRVLSSDSSANISSSSSFDACNMHFSDFKYPALSDDEYFQKKSPISEWACLYSGEAFEAGYDVQQVNNKGVSVSAADNKIVYNYKNKVWKTIPDISYVKNGKINHLTLVQVKSKNASGFMVVNSMAKLRDGTLGESIYFCLIHKNHALCGSGINTPGDKKDELSNDALKLLESVSFFDN